MQLAGRWTFAGLRDHAGLRAAVRAQSPQARWDVSHAELDAVGALWLWQDWQGQLPAALRATEAPAHAVARPGRRQAPAPTPIRRDALAPLRAVGRGALALLTQAQLVCMLWGRLLLASLHLLRHPSALPRASCRPIFTTPGCLRWASPRWSACLIGVVLSYLSSQQLARYGANVLIVDLLGISILRELGPLLAAILVAGRRTGDDRATGHDEAESRARRAGRHGLVRHLAPGLAKTVALLLVLPLLAVWTSALALVGGNAGGALGAGLVVWPVSRSFSARGQAGAFVDWPGQIGGVWFC